MQTLSLILFMKTRLSYAKSLVESNYGRVAGWLVEIDGQFCAELRNYKMEDQFIDSYEIDTSGYKCPSSLFLESTWKNDRLRFRSKLLNKYATNAFSLDDCVEFCRSESKRVSFRGLYISPSNFEERILCNLFTLVAGLKTRVRVRPKDIGKKA